jgi:ABC-type phosphonate transport system ATPase subunit
MAGGIRKMRKRNGVCQLSKPNEIVKTKWLYVTAMPASEGRLHFDAGSFIGPKLALEADTHYALTRCIAKRSSPANRFVTLPR